MQAVGQTRPGRLGEEAPSGAAAVAPVSPVADPRAFVEEAVQSHKVVVFSKQICPSSRKAKEVIELDQRPDGSALQDTLEQMTGKHTVPIVFLSGSFIGGADNLSELESSGQLTARLGA